jgi:CheY-like chemotaxis protein
MHLSVPLLGAAILSILTATPGQSLTEWCSTLRAVVGASSPSPSDREAGLAMLSPEGGERGTVGNGRDFTILIIEDQALIASNIEDVARNIGASVVGSAAQVSDALALVETASWDAALVDITLANGELSYPVAERLEAKDIPFAFLTAWDGEHDARYKDVPVLRKPFSLTELENCLEALVGGRPWSKPVKQKAA